MERRACRAVIRASVEHPGDLAKALEPDNARAPPGVSVMCTGDGVLECVVEVECRGPRGILTLRNTVDDLLQALQAAESALRASG